MHERWKAVPWIQRVVALLLLIVGLTLTVGGAVLAASGGSFYYVLTGLALIVSGALIWRGDARGVWLYGAMLIWTVAWSVWEVGFIGWQLAPRLIAPFVLAAVLLLPPIRQLKPRSIGPWRERGWLTFASGLVLAIVLGGIGHALGPGDPDLPSMRLGLQSQIPPNLSQPLARIDRDDWEAYGNDQGGTRFSPLTQINTSNVARLTKVWEADMAPTAPGPINGLQVTPIMIGERAMATTASMRSRPKLAANAGDAIFPRVRRPLESPAAAWRITKFRT